MTQPKPKTIPRPKPAPFLEYLDKEMTIMGILASFAIGLAALVLDALNTEPKGILSSIRNQPVHVLVGTLGAVLASSFFYLQRSLLAWYYGQISLEMSRGGDSQEILDLLEDADGWNTWLRYQVACVALLLSVMSYSWAVSVALLPGLGRISNVWTAGVPVGAAVLVMTFRWYVLARYPHDEYPFRKWWQARR